jgi:hypothetical protein
MMATYGQKIDRIEKTVTNEMTHAIATKQQMGGLGVWIEANKSMILLGVGLVILAYSLGQRSSCRCPVSDGSSRRTNGRLGSSLQDRVTDKAISYGISEIFKKR